MFDYVIGDVQGCFESLQRLLKQIDYQEHRDRLWFTGDLVNRGPESLKTIRFIKNLPRKPVITLGNHDLHLLLCIFTDDGRMRSSGDTLQEILQAHDVEEIGHWLRKQHILYHDDALNVVMTHAGIPPFCNLPQAKAMAEELEEALHGEQYYDFLINMYGNQPDHWSDDLEGMARLRVICNYFTRMRLCDARARMDFCYKGTLEEAPANLYPWYKVPERLDIPVDILFGHWAALSGVCPHPRIHALDTGCLWGKSLTALRLQDKQRFSVPCERVKTPGGE